VNTTETFTGFREATQSLISTPVEPKLSHPEVNAYQRLNILLPQTTSSGRSRWFMVADLPVP
jgi:hypothetical protein